ncbi:MAG: N-acetyltransferase [Myxococcales bacterium]|nr:N-acetyltransferase [Myxococcales bacterium]
MRSPARVHETSIVASGVTLGAGTRVWHFCHVMQGATIGEGCVLGQNVHVGPNVRIGNRVKIQNNVSVYSGVILEDDVFCGPSMVFTNVLTPRAFVERKDAFVATLVGRGATIGANATVVCGVTIGRYAMVGAGAVVTRDVAPHALVVGNPARQHGWVCRCGEVLRGAGDPLVCGRCEARYRLTEPGRLDEIEGERDER